MTETDDVAWVLAGVLAATGSSVDDVTTDPGLVRERLAAELGLSSRWQPGPLTGADGAERYLADAMQPVARWTSPPPELVAAVAGAVGAAGVDLLRNPAGGWAAPSLRLAVGGLDDAAALRRKSAVAGIRLVPHVRWRAPRIWWRWPLRVGVVGGAGAAGQVAQLTGDLTELFTVSVVTPSAEGVELEILVLPDGGAAVPDGVSAACVVLPGGTAPVDADVAAVGLTGSADLTWFPRLIAELAHDHPLDVAVTIACPDSSVFADELLLPITSVRVWALRLADALDRLDPATVVDGAPVGAAALGLRALVADGLFDMERRGGTDLSGRVRALDAAGLAEVTTVRERVHTAEAVPPDEDSDRGGEEATPEVAADARRLQAQLLDPTTKKPVPDRFLAGTTNHLRVRIAAEAADGAVAADAPFVSPTPGRDAELTVEVIAGDTHARRTVKLPAAGDSVWTRVVPFEVPANVDRFQVFVQVWFSGRVVQSLTLSGPALAREAAPPAAGEGLRLRVDASTPLAAVHEMSPAGASFTVVPGLTGEPLLLDLARTRLVSEAQLARATGEVKSALLDAFMSPPTSLAGAARVLTGLAVKGSSLYRQLRADAYDGADWIHVSTFPGADVPLELVYTHPMPDSRDEVPVCPTALAGTTECAAGCPDRARSDVVCPFGFWATSKVVERRAHTDDRANVTVGAQRSIALLAVGAAGVSAKADEADPTSASRILAAVEAAVAAGGFHRLTTWDDLKQVATIPARLLVLVTHTIAGDPTQLELGTDPLDVDRIDKPYVNPGGAQPGPVVLAIGCETEAIEADFGSYVGFLFYSGAELVVSAISKVPGSLVADFVVRFFEALPPYLAAPGHHRFGEVLTAIRRQTVARGDVLALALTAAGDADVALQGL